MIRKHIFFFGRVQGVGFRYHAVYKARQLGLAGWVRNLDDGSVEMEAQGSVEDIERLIQHLGEQRFVVIERMESRDIPVIEERDFRERM